MPETCVYLMGQDLQVPVVWTQCLNWQVLHPAAEPPCKPGRLGSQGELVWVSRLTQRWWPRQGVQTVCDVKSAGSRGLASRSPAEGTTAWNPAIGDGKNRSGN